MSITAVLEGLQSLILPSKNLKDAGVVNPSTLTFNLFIWILRKAWVLENDNGL